MNRDVRLSAMQTTLAGLVSDGLIQLPADCREVQSVRLSIGGAYQEIHPLPPEYLADTVPTTAVAKGYVAVGNILNLIGGSGSPAFAVTYWQRIPALTATNSTNWLLSREPGIYLYASLIEASPYIQDDARAAVWVQQYQDILTGMQRENDRFRYGNSPAVRLRAWNLP